MIYIYNWRNILLSLVDIYIELAQYTPWWPKNLLGTIYLSQRKLSLSKVSQNYSSIQLLRWFFHVCYLLG
jgi:hypothetical protein